VATNRKSRNNIIFYLVGTAAVGLATYLYLRFFGDYTAGHYFHGLYRIPWLLLLSLLTYLAIRVVNAALFDFAFRLRKGYEAPTLVRNIFTLIAFVILFVVIFNRVYAEINLGALFTTSAIFGVIIGLALQDTLGNFFAGLAIQIEKPFRVGHWVSVRGTDGQVSEITWRATKMRTKAGNFVIVPNSLLSRDTIVNYSEPAVETRLELEVGVHYDVPPNRVKSTILAAIKDEPLISRNIEPEVLLVNFGESSITYRIRVWMVDFASDERLKDHIRSSVYYAFHRSGIVIPYPMRTVIMNEPAPSVRDAASTETALRRVSIFANLPDEQRAQIAGVAHRGLYASGEAIVRQGQSGCSMFVLLSGEAAVLLEPGDREVARIAAGGFFGEMSLLTGAPRSATVRTTVDSEVLEITADDFKQFVLANPAVVEQVGAAVSSRQAELDQARAQDPSTTAAETPQRLVDRIKRFFGLIAN